MDLEQAKQFVANKHSGQSVLWIDKGQMNHIAIVNKELVYKFPKKPEYFALLQKEYALYKTLDGAVTLQIPKAIELNVDLCYLCVTYVQGATLTEQQVAKITHEQKIDLGKKLAVLIKELNVPTIKAAFDIIAVNDPNDFLYVEKWLKKIADFCAENPNDLTDTYSALYKEFSAALPYGFCKGNLLAHKDLHEDNMLFDAAHKLSGVIDFAEVRYTNLHSELRTVIRFGDEVVDQIIADLGNLAAGVKTADVKLFAKVYEQAIVVQNKFLRTELPWRVAQAEFYLQKWSKFNS